MAATIKIKNSSTTGAVPTSSDLVQGELAVNVTDLGLYTENASGTVVKLNAPSIDDKNTGATKHLTISTGGNLGLGVTPSAWGSGFKAFENQGGALYSGSPNAILLGNNFYYNGTNNIYKNTNLASAYSQNAGVHAWFNAASGTAGNAITFTQAMTLDASGNWMVGSTGGESKANVFGGGTNGFTSGTLPPGMTIYGNATNGYGSMLSFKPDTGAQGVSGIAAFRVSGYQTDLRFYTNNTNSGNAFSERARIDESGNLLVGKTSASYTTYGGMYSAGSWHSASTSDFMNCYSTSASAYRFYVSQAGTVFATSTTISSISDIRFKENVRDLDAGLAEVLALKPRLYDWKEGKGANIKNARGFIAQEFEEVFPDLIDEWRDPAPEGEEPYKSVRQDLIPVLVKAIQEMKTIIDQQAERIAALEAK